MRALIKGKAHHTYLTSNLKKVASEKYFSREIKE